MLDAPRFFAALLLAPLVLAPACSTTSSRRDGTAPTSDEARVARLEQERAPASDFLPFLSGAEPATARRAALALGRLERRDALEPLLTALASSDPGLRATAAFGLGQLDLALDPAAPPHQADRARVEQALTQALSSEADAEVRRALVRALGRLAEHAGLDALVALGSAEGPLRAEALVALGVSGARRRASRSADPALLAAVAAGLQAPDERVRAGAAYALFRQKAKAPEAALRVALASQDPQVRIFAARAAPSQDDAVAAVVLDLGLKDADWRVRVEALRGAGGRGGPIAGMARALEEAVGAVDAARAGPAAHVAREACLALASTSVAPAELAPRLRAAAASLAKAGAPLRSAACTCAAALDAVQPEEGALPRCGATGAELSRFDVERVARARVSAGDRAAVLAQLLKSDDVKLRMAAAAALVGEGSEPAVRAAAAALATEADVGVISTLLEPFTEPDASELLSDAVLYPLAGRLKPATTFEGAEPLVTLAKIARARATPTGQTLVEELAAHSEPRVRDAARGVLPGDRAPGARAAVIAAPPLDELPAAALLHTRRGVLRVELARDLAPATVANFAALARAGAYNGTPFHRVIADFVAQGGDHARGDGAGGPGYTLACENSDAPYERGAVGMAHAGKDTGGSQFFLTHSWQPHLDGRYTQFGRVTEGLDVMDAIQPDDVLERVEIP